MAQNLLDGTCDLGLNMRLLAVGIWPSIFQRLDTEPSTKEEVLWGGTNCGGWDLYAAVDIGDPGRYVGPFCLSSLRSSLLPWIWFGAVWF